MTQQKLVQGKYRCMYAKIASSTSSHLYIHPSDLFRVAYAANISEHLPTQPWEYTHKDQTTTPGTTCPTPCEQWVGSLTSYRVIYEQGLWDGAYGLSSSEKTRKSNHRKSNHRQLHFKPDWTDGKSPGWGRNLTMECPWNSDRPRTKMKVKVCYQ